MKTEQFKELEKLLGELEEFIGEHPITITTGMIQNGYAIGVFHANGKLKCQDCYYDIESTAIKLKEKLARKELNPS